MGIVTPLPPPAPPPGPACFDAEEMSAFSRHDRHVCLPPRHARRHCCRCLIAAALPIAGCLPLPDAAARATLPPLFAIDADAAASCRRRFLRDTPCLMMLIILAPLRFSLPIAPMLLPPFSPLPGRCVFHCLRCRRHDVSAQDGNTLTPRMFDKCCRHEQRMRARLAPPKLFVACRSIAAYRFCRKPDDAASLMLKLHDTAG